MKPRMQVGDVVQHRATGLLGRVKKVVQGERETENGPEPCEIVYVCLEPNQWIHWFNNEIDRIGREGTGDAGR